MTSAPAADLAALPVPALPADAAAADGPAQLHGSWRSAWRRLRRDRVAMASLAVLVAIVACCLAAPLWAHEVAHVGPTANDLTGTFVRGGRRLYVVTPPPDSRLVGPGLSGRFLLGADANGRDVMVRLLYGGRNSLLIAFVAALITLVLATVLGLAAGYVGGRTDAALRALFDVLWSFPVLLLGIALGSALAIGGLHLGPLDLQTGSLWIPILVIGAIYVPYLGRPVRAQVRSLRRREFVEAAVAQGMGPVRVALVEVLPNLTSTLLVFGALIVANDLLTEAALSFLGAGVQSPTPSWGNLIGEGVKRITTAPHLTIVPGLAITAAVLSLNLLGDGVRDALDPRSRTRWR